MIRLFAIAAHVVVCLFDLGHCAEIVETPRGLRCAIVAARNTCPASLDVAGWHQSLNVTACSRACGGNE